MNANNSQVAERTAPGTVQAQERKTEAVLQPPLDIFEDADGITLEADMAGVSKDRLNIHVDGENLILEGRILFEIPQQSEPIYADVHSTLYRCSFVLSRELEIAGIRANLKDGILHVRIPKKPEVKPRRIVVES